ncbi:hypothetical protein F4802DRAFT_554964 [Xylaria palmicola]|nr:hypothetical protein F4802DRAFT_554964 [Xylaria palmicola]
MPDPSLNKSGSGTPKQTPLTFTIAPTIAEFSISPANLFTSRPDVQNLLGGTVIFRPASGSTPSDKTYETLLIRRAPSDSFPLKWEIPGGTADPKVDHSIIEVAVRELFEETQLRARRLCCTVGLGLPNGIPNLALVGEAEEAKMDSEYNFCLLRVSGMTWAIVTFMTEIEDEQANIVLREDEHVEWAWVTETEAKNNRFEMASGRELEFVSEAMRLIVLEGFRLKKEMTQGCDQNTPS